MSFLVQFEPSYQRSGSVCHKLASIPPQCLEVNLGTPLYGVMRLVRVLTMQEEREIAFTHLCAYAYLR